MGKASGGRAKEISSMSTLENTTLIKSTGRELSNGPVAMCTQESTEMTRDKDLE